MNGNVASSKDRASNPLVSVGLPVYNGEQFLGKAISSILDQTFEDFELIICDNGSDDGTEEICRGFAAVDQRVRYFRNESNIGAAPNFNKTFELARGKYFKWAAHDDVCLCDFLSECVKVLESDDSVVLCTVDTEWIDENGDHIPRGDTPLKRVGSPQVVNRFRELVLEKHWCTDVFGLIRSSELRKTQRIASYTSSDRVLLAELGLLGRFFCVPRVLFLSRDHPSRSGRCMNSYQRARWFNTSHRGRFSLPYWRVFYEYGKIVYHATIPSRSRLGCVYLLIHWSLQNHRYLLRDLKKTVEAAFGRTVTVRSKN